MSKEYALRRIVSSGNFGLWREMPELRGAISAHHRDHEMFLPVKSR